MSTPAASEPPNKNAVDQPAVIKPSPKKGKGKPAQAASPRKATNDQPSASKNKPSPTVKLPIITKGLPKAKGSAQASAVTNPAPLAKAHVSMTEAAKAARKGEDSVSPSLLSSIEASTIELTPPKPGKAKKVPEPKPRDKENEDIIFMPGEKVDGRWVVVRKLGEGSFGAVYEANDAEQKVKQPQALKLEKRFVGDQVLKIEVAVLQAMKSTPKHICHMVECGKNAKFNYMVMTLLGPSLTILRKNAENQKFSLSTSIRLLLQFVEALRDMHNAGWIHRDLKPSNFAMGKTPGRRRHVYLFDFGLARAYMMKDKDRKMIQRPKRQRAGFRGTQRYCSINAHERLELGRHDDLIGILYAFLELATGSLPWKNLDECDDVKRSKEKSAPELYTGMPDKFNTLHAYLHSLKYEDRPNYRLIEESLLEIIQEKEYHSQPFDWETCRLAAKFWNTADLPMESSQSSSMS